MNQTNIILFPITAIHDVMKQGFTWDDIEDKGTADWNEVHSFPSIQLNALAEKNGHKHRCETDLGKIVAKYQK